MAKKTASNKTPKKKASRPKKKTPKKKTGRTKTTSTRSRAPKKTTSRKTPTGTTLDERLEKDREQYQQHKERTRSDQFRKSRAGREIRPSLNAALKLINTKRRESCRTNFRRFCETYFPDFFDLGWSPAHRQVIKRIETAVLKGGLFAVAMPRGSGKTTLSICAVVCAVRSRGHQCEVQYVNETATKPHGETLVL